MTEILDGVAHPVLEIVVPGKTHSGNRGTRTARGSHYKPAEAVAFEESVYGRIFVAAREAKWTMPPWVRVDVTLYNCRQDRDNAIKVLMDAMQGVAYGSGTPRCSTAA